MARTVTVAGNDNFGNRLFLIAGPCLAESEELCIEVAGAASDLCDKYDIDYIFKASFDKANRSSIDSERGPGLEKGLEILSAVREKTGAPVLSDIHIPEQAAPAAEVLDVIQIPAFLCRQTDLLLAAAKTGKPVNVKKGQFMAPWDMENVVRKLEVGYTEVKAHSSIIITERGSTFGYNTLVTDMRNIPKMQHRCLVVIDATHSVQLPGGQGLVSGGESRYVGTIALAGIAAGADGLFLETHPQPEKALCDPDSMLKLENLDKLLEKAVAVYDAVRQP